ncbi:MAG: transposase [Pseudomonadota bacterium]
MSGRPVFFTVCLAHRGASLLVDEVAMLRAAVAEVKAAHPFEILAWVVLPDHLHAVWRLPDGDRAYGQRWGAIKSNFSRGVLRKHGWPKTKVVVTASGEVRRVRTAHHGVEDGRCAVRTLRASHVKRRELGIWQRRFWEHHVRDEAALGACVRYCWVRGVPETVQWTVSAPNARSAPVKHGLVARAVEWPYSSIHRDVRAGRVEAEWQGAVPEMEAGEP